MACRLEVKPESLAQYVEVVQAHQEAEEGLERLEGEHTRLSQLSGLLSRYSISCGDEDTALLNKLTPMFLHYKMVIGPLPYWLLGFWLSLL